VSRNPQHPISGHLFPKKRYLAEFQRCAFEDTARNVCLGTATLVELQKQHKMLVEAEESLNAFYAPGPDGKLQRVEVQVKEGTNSGNMS
jgi:hypothetical protein